MSGSESPAARATPPSPRRVRHVTPDHAVLAYSVDFNGGERYVLRFRDLTTGDVLDDVVENVTYGLAWANDARTCFYVRPDDAMRPHEVWRHVLGTPASDDVLVL